MKRHVVDAPRLVEEGHEDRALRWLTAAVGPHGQFRGAAPRLDDDEFAVAHAELARVVWMHLDIRGGHGARQRLHTACHRARMPVLEHAASAQPHGVLVVRHLRWRDVVVEPDLGTTVAGRRVVELQVLPLLDVGVVEPGEAEARLAPRAVLLLDDGPAQSARLDVLVVRRDVLVLHAREGAVLLEERLVDVDVVVVLPLPDGDFLAILVGDPEQEVAVLVLHARVAQFHQAMGQRNRHPGVVARLARWLDHLEPLLGSPLGVAVYTVLLDPHRGGQDQVGQPGGRGRVDFGDHHELLGESLLVVEEVIEVGQRLARVCDLHEDRIDVAAFGGGLRELLPHRDGVVAGLRMDAVPGHVPEVLALPAMRLVGDETAARQGMRERADLSDRSAGGGLARQAHRRVAGRAEVATEQVHSVHERVDRRAHRVLVHAHAPEAGDLDLPIGEEGGHHLDLLGGDAREFLDVLRRVLRDALGPRVEVDRHALEGELALGVRAEVAVPGDELLVPRLVVAQAVEDTERNGHVTVREHLQVLVGLQRGTRAARTDVDDLDGLAARAPIDHARPQHRMHLGGVVAPGDQYVASVEVGITARGLVHAVGAYEAGHGGCHAKARIGIDVVVAETALHQLLRGEALGDRPLARSVDREALGRLHDALGPDVDRFVPGDRDVAVPLAQQRLGEAVLAVERHAYVVALHAKQTLVDVGLRVAGDRHDATVLDADLHVAASAAEATRRLVPRHAVVARHTRLALTHKRGRRRCQCCCRGCHRGDLEECASIRARPHHSSPSVRTMAARSSSGAT